MTLMRSFVPAACFLAAAAGCSDVSILDSGEPRVPAEVEIVVDREVLTAGESTPLGLRVLDQNGQVFEHLPPWVRPVWRTTNTEVLRVGAEGIEAASPGESNVLVEVADRVASLRLRVNPSAVRVGIHAHFNQSVQDWDGTLPLVAGRDAVLRVFLSADQINFFEPGVRVRFFRDGAEVAALVSPSRFGIPVQVSEGVLASSYNLIVPGSVLQPGTTYVVEALTEGVVPLLGGSVTQFPASGEPIPLEIIEVAPFRIRFVPVIQPGTAMANVNSANVGQFMAATEAVFPLSEVEVSVRQPYTSTASTATEAGWSQLIREVRVLRLLDGRTDEYYHGIVRRIAHWAGLGYVGYPVALSYDALPAANWTVAHELGHNWGRRHAPCGNPSGIDTAFPHAGGRIGLHGVDREGREVFRPNTADLMGYCSPRWISDYTYLAVANFRANEASRVSVDPFAAGAGTDPGVGGPGLLIWGRMTAGGEVILDPPIPVAQVTAPPQPGPYRLEGVDEAGTLLLSTSFAADPLSKGSDGEAHFAFMIPLDDDRAQSLDALRLEGPGVYGERVRGERVREQIPGSRGGGASAPYVETEPEVQAQTRPRGGLELRWDATLYPLLVVRDAHTGDVLSLARGGVVDLAVDLAAGPTELDLNFSDGLRATTRRITIEHE